MLRKREGGPDEINSRMHRLIKLMVHGRGGDPSRTPLGLYEAAAASGYRKKGVRYLFETAPAFRAVYAAEQKKRGAPALTVQEVLAFIAADRAKRDPHPMDNMTGLEVIGPLNLRS